MTAAQPLVPRTASIINLDPMSSLAPVPSFSATLYIGKNKKNSIMTTT